MRAHLLGPLLLVLALAPVAAMADAKSDAKQHIERATAFHGEGKFKQALEQLTLAYALDPKPELLYAIGQVHVQLGNCAQAISFYERFLSSKPAPGPASAAKEAIATCKTAPPPATQRTTAAEPAAEPREPVSERVGERVGEPAPQAAAEPPATRTAVEPAVAERGPRPWYTDVAGGALVGGGVVAGVLGIVFYQQMSSKLDDAEAATTYEAHEAARDNASGKRTLSVVFGVAGVALIGAGVTRYVLRRDDERSNKVSVVPTSSGGLVTWMGRF